MDAVCDLAVFAVLKTWYSFQLSPAGFSGSDGIAFTATVDVASGT